MMKRLSFIVFFLIACLCLIQVVRAETTAVSAFQSVLDRKTIRCGYQYWDGGIYRDKETNKLAGFMVDYTEQLAKNAELSVEWVGPTDWMNIGAEINSNKIDVWCGGTWLSTKNTKFMLVSNPMVYNGFEAFVRGDDARFDKNPELLNDPSVTLAVLGSTSSAYIAKRILPSATLFDLPASSGDVDLILNVAMKKADVAFNSPGIIYGYMKNNPGKIKRLRPDQPYALMGVTYTVSGDNYRLLNLLNTGILELQNTGYTNNLIKTYNTRFPGLFVDPEKTQIH